MEERITSPDLVAIQGMSWSTAWGLFLWSHLPHMFAGKPFEPITPRLSSLALPSGGPREQAEE